MAGNSATVQAILTALAGTLSPLLQQTPTATAMTTLTGHSSTQGTSPTTSVNCSSAAAGSSYRYIS